MLFNMDICIFDSLRGPCSESPRRFIPSPGSSPRPYPHLPLSKEGKNCPVKRWTLVGVGGRTCNIVLLNLVMAWSIGGYQWASTGINSNYSCFLRIRIRLHMHRSFILGKNVLKCLRLHMCWRETQTSTTAFAHKFRKVFISHTIASWLPTITHHLLDSYSPRAVVHMPSSPIMTFYSPMLFPPVISSQSRSGGYHLACLYPSSGEQLIEYQRRRGKCA